MTKLRLLTGLLALLLLATCASLAADDSNDKDKDKDGKSRTVTGCLKPGDGPNEFVLTAKDGSTWELRNGEGVDLAPHVGHTVAVTGTASTIHAKAHEMKEKTKEEAAEHGIDKNEKEHGHLKAADVKMVSSSCTP